jgi:hypothetical protein
MSYTVERVLDGEEFRDVYLDEKKDKSKDKDKHDDDKREEVKDG